ncbi:MAG TPA: PrsW family glutamic-type intramembrane protease [Candidatus Saccharimonadales bacterium]|nr:PrsW family glutamic-type intramembrane protease [Candidatus Saccharimonadales bacterium]
MTLFILLLVFIVLSVGLAWILLRNDRGSKEPIGALWLAAGFGLLGAVAAGLIENFAVPVKDLTLGAPLTTLLLATLGIGAIEEICKFLPLSIFLYGKRYFNERTDGVIYFALAGLGFGLPENILYTLQFGSTAGVGRVLLTPFFHSAITAMIGYYLAKYKLAKASRWRVLPALLAAMVIHGLYDFGLTSGRTLYIVASLTITLGLTVLMVMLYLRALHDDQKNGRSAVGHNEYCRSCGFPNAKHYLYCTHCGQIA